MSSCKAKNIMIYLLKLYKWEVITLVVMDKDGNLFDERRKKDRRKRNSDIREDRRSSDRRIENINEVKKRRK